MQWRFTCTLETDVPTLPSPGNVQGSSARSGTLDLYSPGDNLGITNLVKLFSSRKQKYNPAAPAAARAYNYLHSRPKQNHLSS